MTLATFMKGFLRLYLAGLLLWLILMGAVVTGYCQSPDIKLIEQLKDQSWIVQIGDVEHRALNPEQMRQVLLDKAELEKSRELIANLQDQIALLTAERDALRRADKLADEQLANLNERLTGLEALLKRQTDLFNQYIAANKKSKLAAWLDSPVTSLALKLGVPGLNLLMTGLRLK